jgi:protein involved in polysaccharide export with SLBB domain
LIVSPSARDERFVIHVIVALTLLLAASCGGAAPTRTPPVLPGDDTTLGSGDVFDVRVFGEPDLAATYRVAQDGSIDFPLVGRVNVIGLEPTAVADLLTERLRSGQFLRAPQVSVLVKEYNSKRVSIMGAVARPGTFPMSTGLTVVQAISLAGGFTPLAARNNTVVSRRINGQIRRYRVEVDDVTGGGANDVPLAAGDIVYVPERVF